MSIENKVKDVISAKLEEGLIEKLVAENLEKGVNKALESLLGSYGDVTKILQDKIKEVMISQLSSFDYSNYVVKLDAVLVDILKNTALDHKKLLENFKELMTQDEMPKTVKVTEIFEKFMDHVAENVDTSDLEVNTDDYPSYEDVNVTMEIEYEDSRSWSSFKDAKIIFECEKDEDLNCEIRISKFKEYPWDLKDRFDSSIHSLRHMSEFQLYLLKLYQAGVKIELDSDHEEDYVTPKAEPECEFR